MSALNGRGGGGVNTTANPTSAEVDGDWIAVCDVESVPADGGACVLIGAAQIAVFRVGAPPQWFAVQNRCPHWSEMVLSRALTGAQAGEPKIACPMHKKSFSLKDGRCLSGDPLALETFAVKAVGGVVYLQRPAAAFLERERALASERRINGTAIVAGCVRH